MDFSAHVRSTLILSACVAGLSANAAADGYVFTGNMNFQTAEQAALFGITSGLSAPFQSAF